MQINGKIHTVFETKAVTATFNKREFVIEYAENPNYPQYIKFEVIQDKCGILDNFKKGDAVEVNFNLQGKPFVLKGETLYFNSLQCWKLTKMSELKEIYYRAKDESDNEQDLPF